jgi:outer membrane protein OmpA-like peptidoglycan-associated protein/Tol biopolymer transport system component
LFCMVCTSLFPQDLTTASRRAERLFNSGMEQYGLLNYEEALSLFSQALSVDENFVEAYLLAGDVSFDMRNYHDAAGYFKKAASIDPDFFPLVWLNMGNAWMAAGEYKEARESFTALSVHQGVQQRYRDLALDKIARCDFAINAVNNPVPFDPVDIGPTVNTGDDEYWPALTADEETLMFTRQSKRDPSGRRMPANLREDFYVSYNVNGEWTEARNLGSPLNTEFNEGAPALTADGRYIFFTACNREDGIGSCDIYFAERSGDKWGEPVNIGAPVNTASWEAQPSISPDGTVLYFASNRSSGTGQMDIWYASSTGKNKWSEPVNMGTVINTAGNEMSPFIHPDNKTLYFSSDGHTGMGGYDIFVARRDEAGEWSEPANLGYPLNTYHDELGLIVNARGDRGYFSSDRMTGEVRDIYSFELHEEARPSEVSYMKGTVYDAGTYRRLHADFELIDLLTAETVIQSSSDPVTGEFLVPIATGRDYALNVSRSRYLFYSDNFSLAGFAHRTEPYLKDIPMQPIKEGEKTVLRNIFFEFDSYELKSESLIELEKLVEFMENNPDIRIRINGHTDNIGHPDYNLNLSERRVESVAEYLISAGVGNSRIEYAGFGETMPVAANDTEEGRAENRRTEFEIIGFEEE